MSQPTDIKDRASLLMTPLIERQKIERKLALQSRLTILSAGIGLIAAGILVAAAVLLASIGHRDLTSLAFPIVLMISSLAMLIRRKRSVSKELANYSEREPTT